MSVSMRIPERIHAAWFGAKKKKRTKQEKKKTREQKKGVARAGVEGKNGAGGGGAGLGYTVVGNATINITYRHGSL